MSRTLSPAPPTDRRFWRRLLARVHPDAGGSHDLFLWVSALFEHVAGDHIEEPPPHVRREPSEATRHPQTGDRIPFEHVFDTYSSFADLTAYAVEMADRVPAIFGRLLLMLADCGEVGPSDIHQHRAQNQGATYRQVAYIAHLVGMSKPERVRWYEICRAVPLSQRHAGHLIARLQDAES